MEDVSVSKGVFAHCKYKFGQRKKQSKSNSYKNEPWYKAFKETCSALVDATANVNSHNFRQILDDLKNFIVKIKNLPVLQDEIPTGILLAGVNLPDHNVLLNKLVQQLSTVTPYIATVWSRDAGTFKNLTEETIYQIINTSQEDNSKLAVKKSHCTFCALNAWHKENNNVETPIIIIIPDFESFSPKILHDFILVLSSYSKSVKFVLIFGVATTLHVVHRSLSYDATSKLKVQVFHTQTQVQSLSNILDGIVLSPNIPFKLTGKAIKLLMDSFMWYDFSVNGFIQSYKVCMWKHFYRRNEKLVCCKPEAIKHRVLELTNKDLKTLKNLPSVKEHLDSLQKSELNEDTSEKLMELLEQFHIYINNFLIILKCLHKLTADLPDPLFGKTFREIYAMAVGTFSLCESVEYKQALQLIGFLSKEEILSHIKSMLLLLENGDDSLNDIVEKFKYHQSVIKDASLHIITPTEKVEVSYQIENRRQWKEQLKSKAAKSSRSPYAEAQKDFIEYLDKQVFSKYLISPYQVPLHEIFCYDDSYSIRRYLSGSMKGTVHHALNDPSYYFKCECCPPENDILPTHPDLNIMYRLHLESKKMINVYDWLQAFSAVVNPNEDNEEQNIDPLVHARFTQTIAELQFLGFIKATRKKTDHVKKLS